MTEAHGNGISEQNGKEMKEIGKGKEKEKKKGFAGQQNPEERANWLSKLTFWWANEYVKIEKKKRKKYIKIAAKNKDKKH